MSDMDIYNEFYQMFGKEGMKRALDGFNRTYDHFGQVHNRRHREVVIKRMSDAIRYETNLNNNRKVMSKDQQRVERVWVTATGREIPISRMDDDHLNNTILFIDRRLAEGQWQIGLNKDPKDLLIEMEAERVRRNMPLPLLSIKSLAFRKGELK